MKRIALHFMYYATIVEMPDEIAININKYRKLFDNWLYNKDNNHKYWVYVNGKKMGVSFGCEAFIEFLNDNYLKGCKDKVSILEEEVYNIPCDIPTLHF